MVLFLLGLLLKKTETSNKIYLIEKFMQLFPINKNV